MSVGGPLALGVGRLRVTMRALVRAWGSISLMFVAATILQVLMYSRPLRGSEPIWGSGSPMGQFFADHLYTPLVFFFVFGPGVVAAGLALRILYRAYAAAGSAPPMLAVFVIIILTLASCYAGVFISFNTWGT